MFLDLDPAPAGRRGQIIDWHHVIGPTRVIAARLGDWLNAIAEGLEAGHYVYVESENIVGPPGVFGRAKTMTLDELSNFLKQQFDPVGLKEVERIVIQILEPAFRQFAATVSGSASANRLHNGQWTVSFCVGSGAAPDGVSVWIAHNGRDNLIVIGVTIIRNASRKGRPANQTGPEVVGHWKFPIGSETDSAIRSWVTDQLAECMRRCPP
ncbi:MAG TPA: hypothetical protein VGX78_16975 [Pirellulales bacterium]|nr:hypothetical protein [Pirellulales bacterium]